MTKQLTPLIFLLIGSFHSINAQWSIRGNKTDKNARWNHIQFFSEEEWDASNFSSEKDMQWFNDARYGMFIHFGLSTYIKKDLSWGMCYTRKAPDKGHGPIADSVWVTYPEHFKFENFDAKQWVKIAKDAGMKYIVTIAKHHDGFHMWDTKYSDFKVTNTPFGRDYLKEIADACHEADMKFGVYYSQRDWYHPDYAPIHNLGCPSKRSPLLPC
ncbi:alpha-L-fucosidase [Aestuariibaculum marinum]|uniref:alpha-L-fucosidase n=1 Tax=Aestuariibaculum marinum TaxID=2683592 RepID=A0A8J6PXB5_9FLAO|nr:alpha-L-fucosidase [Aestuariibaculum marinum]MBD0824633.1 alpha-L-fucosidase [Aestuariibaculum marinum]